MFEEQRSLWSAPRDFYITLAVNAGVDQAQFEACYDSQDTIDKVVALDQIRRERGIRGQPFFDVNGQVIGGTGQLVDLIEAAIAADG